MEVRFESMVFLWDDKIPTMFLEFMNLRLSQNRVEMASFVSSPIEVIWIFLKKGVYKLTFEGFILSNFFFRCHKPPKRLLLQDYVQWPAGRTQFQPS